MSKVLQEFVKGTLQEKKQKTLLLHVLYFMHMVEPMTTRYVTMA